MRGTRTNGFTLIEVMVALLLISIAALGAVRFNQDNQDSLAMLRNQDVAVLLARSKAFELVLDGVNAATDKEGVFTGEHEGFRWSAKAAPVSLEDYYRLEVRVLWDLPRAGSVKVERLFRD